MNNATLYLIQANFAQTEQVFVKLAQMIAPQDEVVLLGESVMHAHHTLFTERTFHIINTDLALVPQPEHLAQMHVLDYADFANLCLRFTRTVTLK